MRKAKDILADTAVFVIVFCALAAVFSAILSALLGVTFMEAGALFALVATVVITVSLAEFSIEVARKLASTRKRL